MSIHVLINFTIVRKNKSKNLKPARNGYKSLRQRLIHCVWLWIFSTKYLLNIFQDTHLNSTFLNLITNNKKNLKRHITTLKTSLTYVSEWKSMSSQWFIFIDVYLFFKINDSYYFKDRKQLNRTWFTFIWIISAIFLSTIKLYRDLYPWPSYPCSVDLAPVRGPSP